MTTGNWSTLPVPIPCLSTARRQAKPSNFGRILGRLLLQPLWAPHTQRQSPRPRPRDLLTDVRNGVIHFWFEGAFDYLPTYAIARGGMITATDAHNSAEFATCDTSVQVTPYFPSTLLPVNEGYLVLWGARAPIFSRWRAIAVSKKTASARKTSTTTSESTSPNCSGSFRSLTQPATAAPNPRRHGGWVHAGSQWAALLRPAQRG